MIKLSVILTVISICAIALLNNAQLYFNEAEESADNNQTVIIDRGNQDNNEELYLDVSNMTLKELLENPEKYKRYIVTVNAIFGMPFEGNYIDDKNIKKYMVNPNL